MLIRDAISQTENLTGAAIDHAILCRWLSEMDGRLAFEFYRGDAWQPYAVDKDLDCELLVPFPWDGPVYVHHLEAMVYFSGGEYARYENARAMSEQALDEFRKFVHRGKIPASRALLTGTGGSGGPVVRGCAQGDGWKWYYLSAYAIAVKHGYQGTEAEWVESLHMDIDGYVTQTKAYADAGDAASLQAAKDYARGLDNALRTWAQQQDANTLSAANAFSTGLDEALRAWTQRQDTNTLSAANAFSTGLDEALRAWAQRQDTNTLSAANAFSTGLDEALRAYVDTRDAAGLQAARDYADAGDANTLSTAEAFSTGLDEALRAWAQRQDTNTLSAANAFSTGLDEALRAWAQRQDTNTLSTAEAFSTGLDTALRAYIAGAYLPKNQSFGTGAGSFSFSASGTGDKRSVPYAHLRVRYDGVSMDAYHTDGDGNTEPLAGGELRVSDGSVRLRAGSGLLDVENQGVAVGQQLGNGAEITCAFRPNQAGDGILLRDIAPPEGNTDAANKAYVDGAVQGARDFADAGAANTLSAANAFSTGLDEALRAWAQQRDNNILSTAEAFSTGLDEALRAYIAGAYLPKNQSFDTEAGSFLFSTSGEEDENSIPHAYLLVLNDGVHMGAYHTDGDGNSEPLEDGELVLSDSIVHLRAGHGLLDVEDQGVTLGQYSDDGTTITCAFQPNQAGDGILLRDIAPPEGDTDAANKAYVDGAVQAAVSGIAADMDTVKTDLEAVYLASMMDRAEPAAFRDLALEQGVQNVEWLKVVG